MKFDSWLLVLLMILKSVSVVPLVAQEYGIAFGALAMLLNVGGYSFLIWANEKELRSSERREAYRAL